MVMSTENQEFHGVSTRGESHTESASEWLSIEVPHSLDPNYVDSMVSRSPAFEGIDLTTSRLSASVAKILRKANTEYLFLTILQPLGASTAGVLGEWPFATRPIRDITSKHEIPMDAARALIGGLPGENECDRPLSISVPTLTTEVARVLVRHTNELYLTIWQCIVDDDIMSVLTEFCGRRLFLDPRMGITEKARAVLPSNPASRIAIWSDADNSISTPKK